MRPVSRLSTRGVRVPQTENKNVASVGKVLGPNVTVAVFSEVGLSELFRRSPIRRNAPESGIKTLHEYNGVITTPARSKGTGDVREVEG